MFVDVLLKVERFPHSTLYLFSYCRVALFIYATSVGASVKQAEIKTKEIKELKNSKADKETLALILDGQKRIEGKLDAHIASK